MKVKMLLFLLDLLLKLIDELGNKDGLPEAEDLVIAIKKFKQAMGDKK